MSVCGVRRGAGVVGVSPDRRMRKGKSWFRWWFVDDIVPWVDVRFGVVWVGKRCEREPWVQCGSYFAEVCELWPWLLSDRSFGDEC